MEDRVTLTIDTYDQRLIVTALNELRTRILKENVDSKLVDDLLIKVIDAPPYKKKFKEILGDLYIFPNDKKPEFIPTLEDYLKINDEFISRRPPNSLDLSPIKIILGIIKQMLVFFPTKDMSDLKNTIKLIWDSISKKFMRIS